MPDWKVPRPSWFPTEFDWIIGCRYRGMPESRAPVRNLLGGNASFRRAAFDLAGGFHNGIGRAAGKRPLGCEETEFCIRLSLRSPGSVLLFDNRAVIKHHVPADRGRFSYFCSRCYAEGLSKALVTVAELAAVLAAGGEPPARTVVLTFDDGFEDFHGRALPLLARYGFTATVFVTTGWVRDSGPLPAGQRPGCMLSWGQIEEAASAGVEVAAHSCLHPQLDQLPGKQLREELPPARHASKTGSEPRSPGWPIRSGTPT